MKPQRFQDAVKLLEQNGFVMIRSSGHQVYANGSVRIALAHQRIVSSGVMRGVYKAIQQAHNESIRRA